MVYASSKKTYAKKSYKPKKYVAKPKKAAGPKPKRKVFKMRSKAKFGKYGAAIPTRISNTNNVVSHSTWLSANKPSYKVSTLEKVGAKNVYQQSTTIAGVASLGCYGITQVRHMTIVDDLAAVFVGTTLPGAQGGNPRQYVLESYISEVSVANNTNVIAEVELYDVVLKRDLVNTLTISIGNPPVAYTVQGNAVDLVLKGLDMAQNIPSNTTTATTLPYGVSIFDSPMFNDYCKVVKRTVIEMSPGGVHQHVVSLKPNRLIREDVVGGSNMNALAGLTCYTLVLIRPTAGLDITTPGITTPQTQINVIQTRRMAYTWSQDIANSLQYRNGVARGFAPSDVVRGFNPLTGIGQIDSTIP